MYAAYDVMMRRAGNDIGDAGATSLAIALKDTSALTTLHLAGVFHVLFVVRAAADCEDATL